MTNQSSEFTNNWEDTVATELSTTGTSLVVNDASGLAVPCFLTLDYDDGAKLELVRVTSKASNTLTVVRYLAGSAQASGLTHIVGATVKQGVVGQMFEDLHDRVEGHTHTGGADGSAVSVDHGTTTGLTDDDHTQYLKEKAQGGVASEVPTHTHAGPAEAGTLDHADLTNAGTATNHVTNGDSHDHSGGDGAQIDHGGLGGLFDDDHTNLLNETRHDALDHSGLTGVGGGVVTAVKTADESRTSTTTLTDDSALTVAVEANSEYAIAGMLFIDHHASPDLKFGFTVPTGATFRLSCEFGAEGATYNVSDKTLTDSAPTSDLQGGTASRVGRITGSVVTSGTAGNLVFQWAQNTSDASAETIRKHSHLSAAKAV